VVQISHLKKVIKNLKVIKNENINFVTFEKSDKKFKSDKNENINFVTQSHK